MDYLDPKKKQRKRTKIMLGYGLLGIAIAMATVVLVYVTTGYDVDRNTGQIIQNGLIYVDSKPESAKIFINEQEQGNQTDARLILPGGSYDIRLERDGYRNWQRTVNLEGGSVRRINYARLVPNTIETVPARNLEVQPSIMTQSIDKRWVVLLEHGNALSMQVVDVESSQLTQTEVRFPVGLVKTTKPGTWEVIEWADDHKTFLATYTSEDGVEYVLINRDQPLESVNVADALDGVLFDEVRLRNRKNDLLFILDRTNSVVYKANTNGTTPVLFAEDVIQFDSFGEDIVYVTPIADSKDRVMSVLQRGEDVLKLRSIPVSSTYLLDMSKLGSAFVVGVGSPTENKVWVYNDPVAAANQAEFATYPVPTTVLRAESPQELRISTDSSVIMLRGGSSFASHEFEEDRLYDFELAGTLDPAEFRWIDGRHFTISIDGVQHMIDYNGDNQYDLVKSVPVLGSFFDKDLDFMFSYDPADAAQETPPRILRSFMRTAEDR